MRFTSLAGLLGLFVSYVSATALTYNLAANHRECFFIHVENDQVGRKIGFYFAVQSGGSFDVDFTVVGPDREHGKEKILLQGEKERQGDFVLTAEDPGEYRFCFDNTVSTFTDKVIDFDLNLENEEAKASLPTKAGVSTEQLSGVDETVLRLYGQVSTLFRQQKYFRTRENRNFSTVRSTERRIFNFSLIESGLMIGMAALQVFIVKMFFTGGRKGYV